MSESKRVIVVGGGVGGLAAAIRLGANGHRVTLVERNDTLGGKLNRRVLPHPNRPGEHFTFDTGPSLLTLPFVFEQLFHSGGAELQERLDLVRLDPISRFTWPDGTKFELCRDRVDTLENVRRLSPGDVDGFAAFLDRGQRVWDLAGELFLSHAPEQLIHNGGGPRQGLAMATVPFRIGMFQRYAKLVDRHVRHEKLRAVLYQYATYSGASPWKAPGTLCVIPHAEMHFGGWYVRGGMYRLAEALADLARENGVEIVTGVSVSRIDVDASAVTGVTLSDGQHLDADLVVCNADTISAFRELIDPDHRPHRPDAKLDKLDPGGSGMVLLLGVDGELPEIAHHHKFMPADYLGEGGDLRAMFDLGTTPDDPCIYVCRSSATDPTQAPAGCENLFVLVSAPAIHGKGASIDWSTHGDTYRDRVLDLLERRCGLEGLRQKIMVEDRWTPPDLRDRYRANAGGIYGVGGNGRIQAFLRPPNRDKRLKNLLFAGGATHPGGGLPLVALSGKIVSELAEADFAAAG
ncbi:MAG: phytoene desaturase family protein [Planctomycetota bacterium]